jgi:hypothetical protein
MVLVVNDDLDPMEREDLEEEVSDHSEEVAAEEVVFPSTDLDVSLEQDEVLEEVTKDVAVVPEEEKEAEVKQVKHGHMVPQNLIDQKLEPDDLLDEGCI